MQFRQRFAWLLVFLFLAATCGLFYYIFEINDHYNIYALDHVEKFHSGDDSNENSSSSMFGFLWHLTDVPLAVWLLICFFPYLQVFCMLMACTKPEPRVSMAFLWPGYVYFRCRRLWSKIRRRDPYPPKAMNSPLQNGHIVIDT